MADIPLFWNEYGDCTAEVVGYINETAAKRQRILQKKKLSPYLKEIRILRSKC